MELTFRGQWWLAHCASWSMPVSFSALLKKSVLLISWDPVCVPSVSLTQKVFNVWSHRVCRLFPFPLCLQAMAKFHAPVIQDNPSGWGPCAVPEKFKDMPYQPFSKGDRLGKVCFQFCSEKRKKGFPGFVFFTDFVCFVFGRLQTGPELLTKTRDTQVSHSCT